MQPFEILLTLTTTVLLVTVFFFWYARRLLIINFLIAGLFLVLHENFEVIRWQLIFVYLAFIVSGMLILKKSVAGFGLRCFGFAMLLLLMGSSVLYAIGMPILNWPLPGGPYPVGTTSFSFVDPNRPEVHTTAPYDKREIFVEVWYPGNAIGKANSGSLWSELYKGPMDRVSFFLKYLSQVKVHSFPELIPVGGGKQFPLLLFNHGLQMFPAQNTHLMEHLASNGYVIVSIAHPYECLRVNLPEQGTVIPEFITSLEKLREAMVWIEKASAPIEEVKANLASIGDKEKRSALVLEAIRDASTNHIVAEWTADNLSVLDHLFSSAIPDFPFLSLVDSTKIGIMGMSIGGATAGQLCKTDPRIKAGLSIDGIQYGTMLQDSMPVPFLVISSDDGFGFSDFVELRSKDDFFEYHIVGTRHSDFTDLALVWPILKMYGQSGEIPPEHLLPMIDRAVLNFWDHYLKQKPFEEFEANAYPEL